MRFARIGLIGHLGHIRPMSDPGFTKTRKVTMNAMRWLTGAGVLLLRSARPIVLTLGRWVDRKDSQHLLAQRADLERVIQHAHATSR